MMKKKISTKLIIQEGKPLILPVRLEKVCDVCQFDSGEGGDRKAGH
jgi:hypothetical protein